MLMTHLDLSDLMGRYIDLMGQSIDLKGRFIDPLVRCLLHLRRFIAVRESIRRIHSTIMGTVSRHQFISRTVLQSA